MMLDSKPWFRVLFRKMVGRHVFTKIKQLFHMRVKELRFVFFSRVRVGGFSCQSIRRQQLNAWFTRGLYDGRGLIHEKHHEHA